MLFKKFEETFLVSTAIHLIYNAHTCTLNKNQKDDTVTDLADTDSINLSNAYVHYAFRAAELLHSLISFYIYIFSAFFNSVFALLFRVRGGKGHIRLMP